MAIKVFCEGCNKTYNVREDVAAAPSIRLGILSLAIIAWLGLIIGCGASPKSNETKADPNPSPTQEGKVEVKSNSNETKPDPNPSPTQEGKAEVKPNSPVTELPPSKPNLIREIDALAFCKALANGTSDQYKGYLVRGGAVSAEIAVSGDSVWATCFLCGQRPDGEFFAVKKAQDGNLNLNFTKDRIFLVQLVWERIPAGFSTSDFLTLGNNFPGSASTQRRVASLFEGFAARFDGKFTDTTVSVSDGTVKKQQAPILVWVEREAGLAEGSLPAEKPRKWTSGMHTTEATLVKVQDGKATLRKADGKEVAVAIDTLSKEDQEYIQKSPVGKSGAGVPSLDSNAVSKTAAERERQIAIVLALFGDAGTIGGSEVPEISIARDMIDITKASLTGRKLSEGWPLAAKNVGAKHKNVSITVQTTKQPGLEDVQKVLGREDVTEEDKKGSVTWYKYGWCHFGVTDKRITILRADCNQVGRRSADEPKTQTSLKDDREALCVETISWEFEKKDSDGRTIFLSFHKGKDGKPDVCIFIYDGGAVLKSSLCEFMLEEKDGKRYIKASSTLGGFGAFDAEGSRPVLPYTLEGDKLQLQGGRQGTLELNGVWKRVKKM